VPADRSGQIPEPQILTFDGPVEALHVRLVSGAVNVVGTRGPGARVEITEVAGPPPTVSRQGGRITVAYDDLPWKDFLRWFDRTSRQREAVVSVSVPAGADLRVGVVDAAAVVSGVGGRTEVRGVSGHTTLVGLGGNVVAETVSGDLEAQALSGPLRMSTVSGDLTVVDGAGGSITADSVTGDMILDLEDLPSGGDVRLSTVSGEVVVRLPGTAGARVHAGTAGGALSSAFDELDVTGTWGGREIRGTLGTGGASLRASTVSGAFALLRRPPRAGDDDPRDSRPGAPALEKDL
jgi:hypothetical protein